MLHSHMVMVVITMMMMMMSMVVMPAFDSSCCRDYVLFTLRIHLAARALADKVSSLPLFVDSLHGNFVFG
jgi:hypothetical protein